MAAQGERAAYVLAGEGWHPGVIGIVASRMVERQHRPVVMVALDGARTAAAPGAASTAFDLLGGLRAAARAPAAATAGHRAAAGPGARARRSWRRSPRALSRTPREVLSAGGPRAGASASTRSSPGEEIGMGLAEELAALAPFGRGNPRGLAADRRRDASATARPMGEGDSTCASPSAPAARARGRWRSAAAARLPVGRRRAGRGDVHARAQRVARRRRAAPGAAPRGGREPPSSPWPTRRRAGGGAPARRQQASELVLLRRLSAGAMRGSDPGTGLP